MKIIVTGGNGLVGNSIIEKLKDHFEIININRFSQSSINSDKIKHINLDLSDKKSISIIKELNPQIVIHCAAIIPSNLTNEEEIYRTNTLIDLNVLNAVKDINCKLIYMSSTIVYGYLDNVFNISEDHKLIDFTLYSKQKIESELFINDRIKEYLILRINAPYGGQMRNKTVLNIFIDKALKGESLNYYGFGNRFQDFTNVEDISSFICSTLKLMSFKNGIYNISFGAPIRMRTLAELIIRITGSTSLIEAKGEIDLQENYKASYSILKAKSLLNWNPRITLEKGILKMINK